MKHLILCKGLQGSGKSTWARQQIEEHPDRYKRVNRDELRAMIDNGRWSEAREKYIRQIELTLAEIYLAAGYVVIVDDTNLSSSALAMWHDFAESHRAAVTTQDFTHVSLEICIERDLKRPNSVGERVIRETYNRYLRKPVAPPAYNHELPDAIICDLDGTLALLNGRNPYDASTCEQDGLNTTVAHLIENERQTGATIILVSGRSVQHKPQTTQWLRKHEIGYHFLFMRAEGDNRRDAIVKQEIYERHIRDQYNILFVLDDRKQVVDYWRSIGLTCLQVAEGDF